MAPGFRSSPAPPSPKAKGEPFGTGLGPTITSVLRLTYSSGDFLRGDALRRATSFLSVARLPRSLAGGALSFAPQPYDWFALVENDDATGSICLYRPALGRPKNALGVKRSPLPKSSLSAGFLSALQQTGHLRHSKPMSPVGEVKWLRKKAPEGPKTGSR